MCIHVLFVSTNVRGGGKVVQGIKLTFFSVATWLLNNYFKVIANSKELVAIMTHTQKNNFYPVTVLDRLNCS